MIIIIDDVFIIIIMHSSNTIFLTFSLVTASYLFFVFHGIIPMSAKRSMAYVLSNPNHRRNEDFIIARRMV